MIKESQGAVWDPTAHPEPRHPDWDWELAPLPHPQEPVQHVASPETQPAGHRKRLTSEMKETWPQS